MVIDKSEYLEDQIKQSQDIDIASEFEDVSTVD
jgi:hypothetical protein